MFNFVKHDLLPKTKRNIKDFWSGFSKSIYEFFLINNELISIRQKIQKKINKWHKDNKEEFNYKNYTNFLKEIGYLAKEGSNFFIETKNVDDEICKIAGPQL